MQSRPTRSFPPIAAASVVLLLILLGGFGIVLESQRGELAELRADQARLERSFAASKEDAASRRETLTARLDALEQHQHSSSSREPSRFPPEVSAPSTLPSDPTPLAEAEERVRTLESELARMQEEFEIPSISGAVINMEGSVVRSFSSVGSLTGKTLGGSNPGHPSWSEQQATGPPDTEGVGDLPTAWASKRPDDGVEWLLVRFSNAVVPESIVVIESHNPGALVRVEVAGPGQSFRTIWRGADPSTEDANEFVVPYNQETAIDQVRITLDTTLVAGWNEIDAIGLEVGDTTFWGSEAEASSTYAQQ